MISYDAVVLLSRHRKKGVNVRHRFVFLPQRLIYEFHFWGGGCLVEKQFLAVYYQYHKSFFCIKAAGTLASSCL